MYQAACEQRRPFVQLRPRVFLDGNQWCALYGENTQDGVAGFGDSPEYAAWNFDRAWCEKIGEQKARSETTVARNDSHHRRKRPAIDGRNNLCFNFLSLGKALPKHEHGESK